MRFHRVSVLSVLLLFPLTASRSPSHYVGTTCARSTLSRTTGRAWVAHSPPRSVYTLRSLGPQRENALIDALYEVDDPRHLKHTFHHSFAHACTRECHCSVADTAHPRPRSGSLSLSLCTQTLLSSSNPALNLTPSSSVSLTHSMLRI